MRLLDVGPAMTDAGDGVGGVRVCCHRALVYRTLVGGVSGAGNCFLGHDWWTGTLLPATITWTGQLAIHETAYNPFPSSAFIRHDPATLSAHDSRL